MVVPIFFVIFAGIVTFGFALYQNMNVINAAREGARAGSMTSTVANIPGVISARVTSLLARRDVPDASRASR